jgi:hypothetical protein
MDRPLTSAQVRGNRFRQMAAIGFPALAAAIAFLPGWVRPSLDRAG